MLLRFGKMNAHTFVLPMIYVNGGDCFVNMKLNVYYGRLSCKDYVFPPLFIYYLRRNKFRNSRRVRTITVTFV